MNITSDGFFPLASEVQGANGGQTVVLISGVLGAATLELGYMNEVQDFVPYTDGAITATNTQYKVASGSQVKEYLKVSNADGATDFFMELSGKV